MLENHVKYYLNLVPRHGIQKRRDPFVKETEKEREIRDNSASQCFDVVLLKDRKHLSNTVRYIKTQRKRPGSSAYLARNGYGRISTQGGCFVIDDDNKRLLARWHHVLGTFPVRHRVKACATSRQLHLQPPYEMSQLTRTGLGVFSPRAHVDNWTSIFIETCKETVSRISSARARISKWSTHFTGLTFCLDLKRIWCALMNNNDASPCSPRPAESTRACIPASTLGLI